MPATMRPCSTSAFATYDLNQFREKLVAQLPNASATITVTGAGPFTYTLQISWQERITKAAGTATTTSDPDTTVTGGGKSETFSYTVSRTVYDRSAVI